ncbi:MAG: hypothetical protein ACRD04_07765 [Terriglobales bacterium]
MQQSAFAGGLLLAGPAKEQYLRSEMAALKALDPDYVLPMHRSGRNFVELAQREMADKLILCCTGSSYRFF